MKKQFAVIGLGRFGKSVALSLAEAGYDVLAVDKNEDKVEEIADQVTTAIQADVTDKMAVEGLSLSNIDVAIVSIAGSLESSVLATILSKEAGAKYIISKAMNEIHGEILSKVGADQIIYPERDTGKRLASNLMAGHFQEFFALSDHFSLVELEMPSAWAGKSLKELQLRQKYKVNMIGIIDGKKTTINIDPEQPLKDGWITVLVGDNRDLKKLPK